MERLLADARTLGYQVVRLETLKFMREVHALHRSMGFQNIPIFDHSEVSLSGLEPFTLFMEQPLVHRPRGGKSAWHM